MVLGSTDVTERLPYGCQICHCGSGSSLASAAGCSVQPKSGPFINIFSLHELMCNNQSTVMIWLQTRLAGEDVI